MRADLEASTHHRAAVAVIQADGELEGEVFQIVLGLSRRGRCIGFSLIQKFARGRIDGGFGFVRRIF
jgi:hypothetical protein